MEEVNCESEYLVLMRSFPMRTISRVVIFVQILVSNSQYLILQILLISYSNKVFRFHISELLSALYPVIFAILFIKEKKWYQSLVYAKFLSNFQDNLSNLFMIPPVNIGQPLVIRWSVVKPEVK